MNFMSAVKHTLDNEMNVSVTENGAVGYRTSGKALLDLNFAVSSLRNASENEIFSRFMKAFVENKTLAMKWLFYARDVRGGLGERRLLRVVLPQLVKQNPEMVMPLITMIPEYGRFDDMWCLLDNQDAAKLIYAYVDATLRNDWHRMLANQPISLLAKWMPSINASSAQTKKYGKQLCHALKMSESDYRKSLSRMRKYIDIVERKMSAKQWESIKYEAVPSRANVVYNSAFLRNDEMRRRAYLGKLSRGETKINASVLYPHDVVHMYDDCWRGMKPHDAAVEAMWKALPDTVRNCGNTIVVADGSGSMCAYVGNTNISALEVANALAIYFAEHSSGQFKDKYITFSHNPQLVDLSAGKSLHDKLQIAKRHNEVADTNIEKVFDLILSAAISGHMRQSDLPKNILIISDMEFNQCATCGDYVYGGMYHKLSPTPKLFEIIKQRFNAAGYDMPRLVFWNVCSRTGTIPVKENDLGVALVSGFSVNIAKMVMSGKTDPFECLLETLNDKRYEPIEEALKV